MSSVKNNKDEKNYISYCPAHHSARYACACQCAAGRSKLSTTVVTTGGGYPEE